jgi:hypothetical protein
VSMQYRENRRWETFALGTRGPESKAKVTPYRPHDQTGDHDGCISDGAESIGRRFLGCGDVAQAWVFLGEGCTEYMFG